MKIGNFVIEQGNTHRGVGVVIAENNEFSVCVYFPEWYGGHNYLPSLNLNGGHCYLVPRDGLITVNNYVQPVSGDTVLVVDNKETVRLWKNLKVRIGETYEVDRVAGDGGLLLKNHDWIDRDCVIVLPRGGIASIVAKGGLESRLSDTSTATSFATTYWSGGINTVVNSSKKKESFMSRLCDIPSRIKRLLNKGEQAMYELEWIDSDLDLTEEGVTYMNEYLFEKFREELGAEAIKQVAEIKKAEKEAQGK